MADKLKAKIYMVGSTSGIEVEVDDKEKFLALKTRREEKVQKSNSKILFWIFLIIENSQVSRIS